MRMMSRVRFVVLMGVAGAGKTTIGRLLAETISWRFLDGDDFHSPDAIEKMRQGTGLTDAERAPWLDRVGAALAEIVRNGENAVVACSALKGAHRQKLLAVAGGVVAFLKGDRALIYNRINARSGHFFSPVLIEEQFALLEEPDGDEGVTVDVAASPPEVVETLIKMLSRRGLCL